MTPSDLAHLLPVLHTEAHDKAVALRVDLDDMERALCETIATILADHIQANQSYYERIRPDRADYTAEDLASV